MISKENTNNTDKKIISATKNVGLKCYATGK